MNGLGFMVWKLNGLPPAEQVVRILQKMGVKWISLKVASGSNPYNQVDASGNSTGNDNYLKLYLNALKAGGIEVGGWVWPYPVNPVGCADRAVERVNTLGLSFIQHDIEPDWKNKNYASAASAYMNRMGGIEQYFCSYRFPTLHATVPYNSFLDNVNMTGNSPQVYWDGLHNPREQTLRSEQEYLTFTNKPFLPIGAAYTDHTPGSPNYWEPTPEDFQEFMLTCQEKRYQAYGFYSLDYIFRAKRYEWLEAIGGGVAAPPVPPDPGIKRVKVLKTSNIRSQPTISTSTDIGDAQAGKVFEKVGEEGDWVKVSGWIWKKNTIEV